MDPAQIASIIVSVIAASAAYASGRANAKASKTNTSASNRVEMEKEAYERARKLDTETIERQDKEFHELSDKYDKLQARYEIQAEQNEKLNDDVARLTMDNYQVHRENNHIVEQNNQILADNQRLRRQGERVIQDNNRLKDDIQGLRLRLTRLQRGMNPELDEPIRERDTDIDTAPMREVIDG